MGDGVWPYGGWLGVLGVGDVFGCLGHSFPLTSVVRGKLRSDK